MSQNVFDLVFMNGLSLYFSVVMLVPESSWPRVLEIMSSLPGSDEVFCFDTGRVCCIGICGMGSKTELEFEGETNNGVKKWWMGMQFILLIYGAWMSLARPQCLLPIINNNSNCSHEIIKLHSTRGVRLYCFLLPNY